MIGMEWIVDILLVILLAATLFHAVRLERALGALKRDRAGLEALVGTFNASTRAAESGIERLRMATEGAGRQIQRQIETGTVLKEDLTFLVQRGEGLADRLDELVRAARPAAQPASHQPASHQPASHQPASHMSYARPDHAAQYDDPPVRSQAERDLLKALRIVR